MLIVLSLCFCLRPSHKEFWEVRLHSRGQETGVQRISPRHTLALLGLSLAQAESGKGIESE